jgi:Fe-S cluster assembly protein SufD
MSALLQSLAQGPDRDVLDAIVREGLPKPRSEAWKYTSLRALERRTFAPAGPAVVDPAWVAHLPAPRVVFVNGWFDADLSDIAGSGAEFGAEMEIADGSAAPSADQVFARLNAALARQGTVLRIPAGVSIDAPFHVVHIGAATGADEASHTRHAIELGEGASASVVEHHVSHGAHSNLATSLVSVDLARGATLAHVRVQDEAPGATLFARTEATLAEDARYARLDIEVGGALSRHEFDCRLAGAGASVQADGVLLGAGRRHVDTRLNIDHAAPDTRCNLTWRGLAADRSRVVLHGGILIRAGADGSNAALSSKNLLLGEQAEIDAQPVLEIHADEVQAAHGATVGGIDPTSLFYLRSRGLPESDARRLLTTAFCRAVLSDVDAALRPFAEAALDRALANAIGATP